MSTESSPDFVSGDNRSKPPLALIAGPTASGKSDLATELACRIEASGQRAMVINADSSQVYADLCVLSARPSSADMRGIEHRLFGQWDGAQPCSAPDWAQRARSEIADCHGSGAWPILVGGTGLYIRTLLDGIAPIPAIDPGIRAEVRALPASEAFAALQAEDPDRARRLKPADKTRIARALEVVRSTGHPLAYWQTRLEGGIGNQVRLLPAILLPDRDALYARCDNRFAQMLDCGAVAEVENLLARGLDPDLPVLRAIGVREIAAMLRGEITREEAIVQGAQATRNYAKRQFTWFRNQPPASWPRMEHGDSNFYELSEILYRKWRLT